MWEVRRVRTMPPYRRKRQMVPNARSLLYRYLLGELTNEEARKIEERARTDDGYGKRLRGTECELFAAYVSGDLTLGARERFENYFLRSGERVEKLSLAKLLYGRAKTGGARFPDAGDPFYVYFLGDLT